MSGRPTMEKTLTKRPCRKVLQWRQPCRRVPRGRTPCWTDHCGQSHHGDRHAGESHEGGYHARGIILESAMVQKPLPEISRDGQDQPWLSANYEGFPLISSLAKLTMMQNDIRATETMVLNKIILGGLMIFRQWMIKTTSLF